MTGYEEILTDPSYAGQIVTFTFPHIGNVGTNEEDIETRQHGRRPPACAASSCTRTITEPANYRATRHFDQWLKARSIVGMCGIDTRALTALIREKGMPNAVIAHARRQVRCRGAEDARRRPGPASTAWTSCPASPAAQRYRLERDHLEAGRRLRPNSGGAEAQRRRDRLRREAQHPAPAGRCRLRSHGRARDDERRGHPGAQARRRVPVERPRRSGGDRQIRRAGDPAAARREGADLRHLPRPPDARRSRSAARPRRCIRAIMARTIR